MKDSLKSPLRLNESDILLLANMAKLSIVPIFISSSVSSIRKLPRISPNTLYLRVGRCVIKTELPTTRNIAIVEQADILRNMLIAFLVCQRFMSKIKNSDLSDFPPKRSLSALITSIKRKYLNISLMEIIHIEETSQNLIHRLPYVFPRVISLHYSPNVSNLVSEILTDCIDFTAYFMSKCMIDSSADNAKNVDIPQGMIACLYDYVRTCALKTIMQHCLLIIGHIKSIHIPIRKPVVFMTEPITL